MFFQTLFTKICRSQSLFAQLARMVVLLFITLIVVHQYQPLLDSLAEHAVNAGCHQGGLEDHSHHH
ncbi:hypothetical protein [Vibrio tapetis]|uniref:hypothetical protein n=1 Tax=Vibrio tapetis TaxID=52443 RepID=UPI000C81A51E|nr:hypothetical protein [Vibrio tapetis]